MSFEVYRLKGIDKRSPLTFADIQEINYILRTGDARLIMKIGYSGEQIDLTSTFFPKGGNKGDRYIVKAHPNEEGGIVRRDSRRNVVAFFKDMVMSAMRREHIRSNSHIESLGKDDGFLVGRRYKLPIQDPMIIPDMPLGIPSEPWMTVTHVIKAK